jgi:hypothetical protein
VNFLKKNSGAWDLVLDYAVKPAGSCSAIGAEARVPAICSYSELSASIAARSRDRSAFASRE